MIVIIFGDFPVQGQALAAPLLWLSYMHILWTRSADGPALKCDRTPADTGMAKYHVLMGRLIMLILENIW